MIAYILYGLFILSCIVLIVVILLQPGKADAGALFTSSVSSTAFGPRGTASILAKITIGAAVSFLLIALALGQPILSGSRSILQSTSAPASTPQASPSPSPATAPVSTVPTPSTPQTTSGAKPSDKPAPAVSPDAKKSPEKKNK